jgi:hypothetical protein
MTPLQNIVDTLEAELGAERLPDGMLIINKRFVEEEFLYLARAVLAAIREPSEAMLKAHWIGKSVSDGQASLAAGDAWRAMIDAALEEV